MIYTLLKDLPTALPENMTVGAVLKREDPRDALVLSKHHEGKCLKTLPAGSIIGISHSKIQCSVFSVIRPIQFFWLFAGTSSLRRIAQILRTNSHLKVHDIRGNLNTRLAKLDALDSKYAGIVLGKIALIKILLNQLSFCSYSFMVFVYLPMFAYLLDLIVCN